MRAVFGVLGLLIVLAMIGLVARKSLQAAFAPTALRAPSATASGVSSDTLQKANVPTAPQRIRSDVERMLQQGAAARASDAQVLNP